MNPPSRIEDVHSPLVLDSSVVINLVASGRGFELLALIPNECLIVRQVLAELNMGPASGRDGSVTVKEMLDRELLIPRELHPHGYQVYEDLVCGESLHTLGDGEAATIAHAVAIAGVAVIDEMKANRICCNLYPNLRIASTVDLFSHSSALDGFTDVELVDSVVNALKHARMSVLSHQLDWILGLIGESKAQQCTSLKKALRKRGCSFDPT